MYNGIQCCNKSQPRATVLPLQFLCKVIFCAFKSFPWRGAITYNGLSKEAPTEIGTFNRLEVY